MNDQERCPTDAPKTIYLQWAGVDHDELEEGQKFKDGVEICWCSDRIFDTDLEYRLVSAPSSVAEQPQPHPNWRSLSDCPKCGEFMGHGHVCQPSREQAVEGLVDAIKRITANSGHAPCRSGGIDDEGVCPNVCHCEWATEINVALAQYEASRGGKQ